MADRHFPVRPNLEQLAHQAKDLLRAIRAGEPPALALLRQQHPRPPRPADAKLAHAQMALARSYGLPSWPRLVRACRLIDAIWRDDVDAVRDLVLRHPRLLAEAARGVPDNWGPPMSYAANLGRDRIIAMLHSLGATDVQYAFERACLQGRIDTARRLFAMGARPAAGAVMGPCETLNADGLAFLLEIGADVCDARGQRMAPVAMLLQTYARNTEGKHRCLELLVRHGMVLPDTPTMALHRGRLDLLEEHLHRDRDLLARTFSHRQIYPTEVGCDADETLALHGTPLAGTTLLHLSVDGDDLGAARWLLERGADVNARAAVDREGFGGHTALFGCVVSQPYRAGCRYDDAFARLLLDHGADPNARASLRKALRFVTDESMHDYPDVTPMGWGRSFHAPAWVNPHALRLISERGGRE